MPDVTFSKVSLGRYVCGIHLSLARELNRLLRQKGIDLTADQCRVLFHLFHNDGCTQQYLTRTLLQDKSGVSRMLESLERKGVLERTPASGDVRQKYIRLTPQGWSLFDACVKCGKEVQEPALAVLTPQERDTLFSLLQRVMDALPQ